MDKFKVLREKFSLNEFRTHQEQIVQDILDKRDLLVLMPTGGGKSLCYQLSALMSPGFTLIISPLIALIWDQIADLKDKGIRAEAWSSHLCGQEFTDLKKAIKSGEVKILYTTPEMLVQSSHLNSLLAASKEQKVHQKESQKDSEKTVEKLLDRIIVDEAHCVSNWGHEFRESYLELITLKKRLSNVQIVAFTATATPLVQLDIIRILGLSNVRIYRQSYIRENLHYFVTQKEPTGKLKCSDEQVDQIYQWIKSNDYLHKTGIIYCLSRENTEELAAALQSKNLLAEYFHASMPLDDKKATQSRWLSGETKIIVATIAFALGINKPNVRFVIHAAMPKSIEGFYQETGRAGRDGKLSRCLLFYNRQDKHILQSMAKKAKDDAPYHEHKELRKAPVDSIIRTEDMYQWAHNTVDCRIESLSRYLGENVIYHCGNCDNCLSSSAGTSVKIRKSVRDFLIAVIEFIKDKPKSINQVMGYINNSLHHYVGYRSFRVFSELQARSYLEVKYELDKSGEIHANIYFGCTVGRRFQKKFA